MDTLLTLIFTDLDAEYTNIQSSIPAIDFTDSPCPGTPQTGDCGLIASNPNMLLTDPVPEIGYYEIEFHLANNFWNCPFNFGNSACGVQIRQAVAHLFDRSAFCANSVVAGVCTPIDNPVPTVSGGGLLSPNPCGYDAQNPQSGSNCVVGAPGGTAYRIKASTGANGAPWLYSPGSSDLNAAAQHMVNAGVATGFNNSTSVLTGSVTTNTPTFFIRSDDAPRKQFGETLQSQICYLFTGSYSFPCLPYLNATEGPVTAFPGFTTSKSSVNLNWFMYTAAFDYVPFFDSSLYFTYNSNFVSGIPSIQSPNGSCSTQSVPTAAASDYMYLCNPTYDRLSSQIENSPCLSASGDPLPGQVSNSPTAPGNGICIGSSQLSAHSAGIQAEAAFGAGEFTIPVFERTMQFAYLNGWTRVINGDGVGLPNYFTWLDTYNPSPHDAGTIRQGFSETTRSVNPFIASTPHDRYIVGNLYDTLFRANPLNLGQLMDWMTYTVVQENNATVRSASGYEPPPGTSSTFHFTLRNDLYFQDGRPVTAYDVAFSYLSMVNSGAFFGVGASGMTGVTVLSPRVFDIGMKTVGPFTLLDLTSLFIVPGRYWSAAGTGAFDSAIAACTGSSVCTKAQYALSGTTVVCPGSPQPGCDSFRVGNMQIDPNKTAATYDPIANGVMIGSGPWECKSGTGVVGTGCSSNGVENPPQPGGSYLLTRFGSGFPPASSTTSIYFRSSGGLALDIWSQENDVNPIQVVSFVAICFDQPVNLSGPCAHWQQGIGASPSGVVGINQVAISQLRYNLNWISPFEWDTSPPLGIGSFPPILHEGSVTLNPCTIQPVTGYDC